MRTSSYPKRLSRHITLAGLTRSDVARQRGIDNTPPPELIGNLRMLARGLDQVRRLLGHRLRINSGYRCAELNAAVGGTHASQHTAGLAADIECPAFGTPLEIATAIHRSPIVFDQCILEFGRWVHLSFSATPRRRVLTIYDPREGYREGLWDRAGQRML